MSDKVYRRAVWHQDPRIDGWLLTEAGYYDTDTKPTTKVELCGEDVRSLITALDKAGWIQPRLDERLRTEDLKITHRLLDLLDKHVYAFVTQTPDEPQTVCYQCHQSFSFDRFGCCPHCGASLPEVRNDP
jgi:rRNA maturation endonuclease Nob1